MRRKALAPLAAAILALSGVYAATVLAGGNKPATSTITVTNNAQNKVTICHATGSKTNPYVVITPDAAGVIDGHYAHQDHRDIIPAFDYVGKDKVVHHFPGQNWTAEGQAIFNNGCKVPKPGQTTGPTSGPTTTVIRTGPTTTVISTVPGPTQTVTVTSPTQTVATKTGVKAVKAVHKKVIKHVAVVSHRAPKVTG
jgi:hypothetical protein